MKEQSNTFLYIFRGGADPAQMSPEQMQQNMDAWFAWINDLRSKGHFEAGEPLHCEGKVLSGTKGQTITDGPYAEGKEEVGGYLVVSASDLEHATELAKGCPIFKNDGTVEVRHAHREQEGSIVSQTRFPLCVVIRGETFQRARA